MFTYNASKDVLHINDSYSVSKKDFGGIINDAENDYHSEHHELADWYRYRTVGSMKREWAAHNLLYNLGLWKDHTKDVDINYPMTWYAELGYNVFGAIAWLFIK